MNNRILLLSLLLFQSFLYADVPTIGIPTTERIFVGVIENRQKQLEKMQQERDRLQKERQDEDSHRF